jgi:LAGLIDADG DNA endonuclease family protein
MYPWFNGCMPIHKTVNQDFFKTWTPEMAYVLGFFAADGSMNESKRGGHYIEFQITDGDLLKKIQVLLESDHKITIRDRVPGQKLIYRLQIGSKIIFEDLIQLGFVQNKTKVLSLPDIPQDFFGDFIRGYFDGDGNVWSGIIHKFDRPNPCRILFTCFTCGSEQMLRQVKGHLADMGLRGGSISFQGRAFRLNYATADSLKLYAIMYYHCRDLYLPRKKVVFDKFINMRA